MSDPQAPSIALGGAGSGLVGYIADMLISLAAIFVLVIVFWLFGSAPSSETGTADPSR